LAQSLKHIIAEHSVLNKWLSRRVLEPFDANNPPAEFKEGKFLIFIGGGQASGKTSLLNHLFNKLEEDGYDRRYIAKLGSFILSDILENPAIRRLRGPFSKLVQNAIVHPERPSIVKILSDKILDEAMQKCAPIVIDYHMDDEHYVESVMKSAKKNGYETILIAPHVSAETYFSRVKERHKKSGRPYDSEFGLRTHKGFAERIDERAFLF
jgi:hypothetical protein